MTDTRLEAKLGFDRIRELIASRCSTDYATARVEGESFSTQADEIRRRLVLTDEMRLIVLFEESFPTSGYIDCIGFLEPIGGNASIDLLSLGKLKTLIDTVRRIRHFFSGIKDGVYPNLKRKASRTAKFPDSTITAVDEADATGFAVGAVGADIAVVGSGEHVDLE